MTTAVSSAFNYVNDFDFGPERLTQIPSITLREGERRPTIEVGPSSPLDRQLTS
jgi:hypothetical protein